MSREPTFRFDYSLRSDVGLVRQANEDSGMACDVLLAVADGLGGHACGEIASKLAVTHMATLIDPAHSPDDMAAHLHSAINAIADDIAAHVTTDPESYGMGTTLTCLALAGETLVVGHIGDSRAYLLRDRAFEQLTIDHTYVQQLLTAGDITPAQVKTHPQRSVILRAIGANKGSHPDVSIREIQAGDRVLVCSDGLSGEVSDSELEQVLRDTPDPTAAVTALIELALDGGAHDNVTCIVADVVAVTNGVDVDPLLVGAAVEPHESSTSVLPTHADPDQEVTIDRSAWRKTVRRYRTLLVFLAGMLTTIAVIMLVVWSQWWVGARDGHVVIGRGMSEPVLGVQFSRIVETSKILDLQLPAFQREQVAATIHASSLSHAQRIVNSLTCTIVETGQWCPSR